MPQVCVDNHAEYEPGPTARRLSPCYAQAGAPRSSMHPPSLFAHSRAAAFRRTCPLPNAGRPPARQHEQSAHNEQRPKDRLVVSSQPHGQIDIEVRRALLGVSCCHARQRTTATIRRQDSALDQYQPRQSRCPKKLAPGASDGDRHDASGEEEPNRRVQELDPYQGGDSFRLGFHEKSQCRTSVDSMGGIFRSSEFSEPNQKGSTPLGLP